MEFSIAEEMQRGVRDLIFVYACFFSRNNARMALTDSWPYAASKRLTVKDVPPFVVSLNASGLTVIFLSPTLVLIVNDVVEAETMS